MAVKFTNNASGTIASSINSTTTTIVLTSGQGSLFPSLGSGDYFFATLVDSSNNLEIVKVTARSTDTMTVVRGQDGTSGRSYTAGDRFELRPVAAAFNALQDFTPVGDISATTISGAIEELDTEKAPLASPAFTGTPTAPTASAGTNTTQVATTAFVITNGVPTGAILLWSGSVASVPSGWNLCDGTNGTPNLRDRFVVGAGSTYAVGATGGSADAITVSHTHTFSATTGSAGAHQHFVAGGTYSGGSSGALESNPNNTLKVGDPLGGNQNQYILQSVTTAADKGKTDSAGAHTHSVSGTTASTGSSGTNANLPPYYALAYIMKL
jgi:hypothetical protein